MFQSWVEKNGSKEGRFVSIDTDHDNMFWSVKNIIRFRPYDKKKVVIFKLIFICTRLL